MNDQKDIVDYLKERSQLEAKLQELYAKENLLPVEKVIIEEITDKLDFVNSNIIKLSGS